MNRPTRSCIARNPSCLMQKAFDACYIQILISSLEIMIFGRLLLVILLNACLLKTLVAIPSVTSANSETSGSISAVVTAQPTLFKRDRIALNICGWLLVIYCEYADYLSF